MKIEQMNSAEEIYKNSVEINANHNYELPEIDVIVNAMKVYAHQALNVLEVELPIINETYVVVDKNSTLKRLTIFHDPKPTIHMIKDQLI